MIARCAPSPPMIPLDAVRAGMADLAQCALCSVFDRVMPPVAVGLALVIVPTTLPPP